MREWDASEAVSEDRGAAQLMGVNVNATISLTFAIGSALAAVAGALAAVAVYLHRREKELDEYERLLFGEDDAATVEPEAAAEEAAPAEDAAE